MAYYDDGLKDWIYFNADANVWYKKKDVEQYIEVQKTEK